MYLSIDGHWDCCYLLANVNVAAINILVQTFEYLLPTLWGVNLDKQLLGHVIMLCYFFGN